MGSKVREEKYISDIAEIREGVEEEKMRKEMKEKGRRKGWERRRN